jgi:hypothetical protein
MVTDARRASEDGNSHMMLRPRWMGVAAFSLATFAARRALADFQEGFAFLLKMAAVAIEALVLLIANILVFIAVAERKKQEPGDFLIAAPVFVAFGGVALGALSESVSFSLMTAPVISVPLVIYLIRIRRYAFGVIWLVLSCGSTWLLPALQIGPFAH